MEGRAPGTRGAGLDSGPDRETGRDAERGAENPVDGTESARGPSLTEALQPHVAEGGQSHSARDGQQRQSALSAQGRAAGKAPVTADEMNRRAESSACTGPPHRRLLRPLRGGPTLIHLIISNMSDKGAMVRMVRLFAERLSGGEPSPGRNRLPVRS